MIRKFRDEELEHHDIGLEHDAQLVGDLSLLFACAAPGTLFGRLKGGKIFVSRKIDFIVTTKDSKPILCFDKNSGKSIAPNGKFYFLLPFSSFPPSSFFPLPDEKPDDSDFLAIVEASQPFELKEMFRSYVLSREPQPCHFRPYLTATSERRTCLFCLLIVVFNRLQHMLF